jgi:CheY-like chemotaxis protein
MAIIDPTPAPDPQQAAISTETGILIAIPDNDERRALGQKLQNHGFRVWTVPDGLRAFDTFLRHTGEIDVLLLDAKLPDIESAEFFRRMRANFPGIPCAFLTQPPLTSSVQEAMRLGARILTRPVVDSELIRVMQELAVSDTSAIIIAT